MCVSHPSPLSDSVGKFSIGLHLSSTPRAACSPKHEGAATHVKTGALARVMRICQVPNLENRCRLLAPSQISSSTAAAPLPFLPLCFSCLVQASSAVLHEKPRPSLLKMVRTFRFSLQQLVVAGAHLSGHCEAPHVA